MQPQHPDRTSSINTAGVWYTDGTLHEATAVDWQEASYENKLATCADFVATMWRQKKLTSRIQDSIGSMDEMKVYADELVDCLDAATRPVPNAEENRRVFGKLKVRQIAVLGMATMGWLK